MRVIKRILCFIIFAGAVVFALPNVVNAEESGSAAAEASKEQNAEEHQPGWDLKREGWYYYDAQGETVTGWLLDKGTWYYLNGNDSAHPGRMAEDEELEINGKVYRFSVGGAMRTGWVKETEGWYYYDASGAKKTGGWEYINGAWYYFQNESENPEHPGLMFNGTKTRVGGTDYYFNASGAMRMGWVSDEGWYYYNSDGNKQTGWAYVNGVWYYLDPEAEGRMVDSGWKKLGQTWYYLHTNGAMATGWLKYYGDWYYMNADGAMLSGWQLIGNDWYYLYGSGDAAGGTYGAMAYSTTIGGYRIDSDGRWITPQREEMDALAQGYDSPTSYLILVNTNTHKVGIYTGSYQNWQNIHYWDCGDGAPESPTVKGVFSVGIRGYYFDSGDDRCYWYTQFYGDYLFHSITYDKNGEVRDGRLGMAVSHGCVRLDINHAKWIYDTIPEDTTVVVY